jgi:ubiquinone/menaquinone biosynthesis C-methylase UbiE/rhodanese-related sulfurtransferase
MSCCPPNPQSKPALSDEELLKAVDDVYSLKAKEGTSSTYANSVAKAFGYTEEQLRSIPEEAHMGLSCGNPVATASLKEGETVVDFGCGGGIDIFLAASKIGPTGQAIGLDQSADMIARARKNAKRQNLNPPQVSFVQAALTEDLPIKSDSVDVIISNCVINLLPLSGKAAVLKEAYRVLQPQGRMVLDDIIAKKPLPENIRNDLSAYVGCISGALEETEYRQLLHDAGFKDVLFADTKSDLNIYYEAGAGTEASNTGCCTTPSVNIPPSFDVNIWVASCQIYALKDGSPNPSVEKEETALKSLWVAYPKAQSSPMIIHADEVAELIRDNTKTIADYAVIDVRRNDHGGGHVRGSYQCNAETFYDELATFFDKFGNTKQVIFYCGSSTGRGPRCAGWYQDYLKEKETRTSTAYVLDGGVKGWLAKFEGQEEFVDKD